MIAPSVILLRECIFAPHRRRARKHPSCSVCPCGKCQKISSMHTIMSRSNVLSGVPWCILSNQPPPPPPPPTRTAHWSNPSPSWDIYVTTLQQRPIPPLSELFWAGPWGGCQCGKQTFFPVHGMLLMRKGNGSPCCAHRDTEDKSDSG